MPEQQQQPTEITPNEDILFGSSNTQQTEPQQTPPPHEPEQQQPQEQPRISFSPEELQTIVQGAVAPFAQQIPSQQQQQDLSPEELDRMLNVYKPSDDFFDRFNDPEKRVNALLEFRDGIVKQVLTAARYLTEAQKQEVLGELTPLKDFYSQQVAREMKNEFLTTYPGLSKYEQVMSLISAKLKQAGIKYNSKEEGFKILADEATKFIKANLDPNFDATKSADVSQNGQPQQQNGTQTGLPAMSTTSVRGGQGGGSGTSSATGNKPADMDLW